MSGYKINTNGLAKLEKDFKTASRKQRSQYRKSLKRIGAIVADDARERIAEVSPETAASIKVGTRGASTVVVSAGDGRPIATLLEGDGHEGKFRHPLFGDKGHWYDQARHPYLWPAWEAKQKEVQAELKKAIQAGLPGAE
jgi:hypothetical protein